VAVALGAASSWQQQQSTWGQRLTADSTAARIAYDGGFGAIVVERSAIDEGDALESRSEKQLGMWDKLKATVKEHGPVFLVLNGTAWCAITASFYFAIQSYGFDGVELMQRWGAQEYIDISSWDKRYVNALIAINCSEMLDPVRIPIILAVTPFVSRWYRGLS